MKAQTIIESLRNGIPPKRGVDLYSVGHEKFINGVIKFHLSQITEVGKIRFISGTWGSGKTHYFRLLREAAFKNNCLVSNVELSVNEAPFNKFERIFYSIVRNITTPSSYEKDIPEANPFCDVIFEALSNFGSREENNIDISFETYDKACKALMSNKGIDIDFKKIIQEYWKTYLPEGAEESIVDQKREEILQWFTGEGTKGVYRKLYGVNKMISRDNAKIMLQSLSEFVKFAGYRGLVILFDEAEQSYSVMRKSALKDAHNNLLSLINGIEALSGIFLIYATTPDFYTDPKRGIVIYGALSGRIGKLEDKFPRALDTVWNFDAVIPTLDVYHEVAKKIRNLYLQTDSQAEELVMDEKELVSFVDELHDFHPKLSSVRFWRVLVKGIITKFDDQMEEEERQTEQIYDDIMDSLRREE